MRARTGIFTYECQSLKFLFLALIILIAVPSIATIAKGQKSANEEANQRERRPSTHRVFVRSKSLLVRGAVVEDKLLKRPEFRQLGFSITRDESDADMVLELRHDLFTMYVFSVVDTRSQVVLLSGKLSSLGGTVAGKVAKRFVKEIGQASGP